VDVVLDGAEHQGAVAGLGGRFQLFLEGCAGLLEDVGGVDELGEVVLPALEAFPHYVHAGLQLLEDAEGGLTFRKLLLYQGYGRLFIEIAHGLGEG